MESSWCAREVAYAHSMDVAIICVVDVDLQPSRAVIDHYMELGGYNFLFAQQIINYQSQSREHAYKLIQAAIEEAIRKCPSATAKLGKIDQKLHSDSIKVAKIAGKQHGGSFHAGSDPLAALKHSLRASYGSAHQAFAAINKNGAVGPRQWRKVIKKLLKQHCSPKQIKALRKLLPVKLTSADAASPFIFPESTIIIPPLLLSSIYPAG